MFFRPSRLYNDANYQYVFASVSINTDITVLIFL